MALHPTADSFVRCAVAPTELYDSTLRPKRAASRVAELATATARSHCADAVALVFGARTLRAQRTARTTVVFA